MWMLITKKPGDGILNICSDSWAVYRGLTIWIAKWATQEWTVYAWPVWGKDMWLDIWNAVKHRTVHVHHIFFFVTNPLRSLGNDEGDTLAWVWWIENSPAENTAHWLHQKLWYAGQKTMWVAAKAWGLPVQLSDIAQACWDCDTCSKMRLRSLPETTAHLARGHRLLQRWQVDYMGPSLRSGGEICPDSNGHISCLQSLSF